MATLRALECLVAVADTGSITEAARLLHSSQPAVSQQIAALERHVPGAIRRYRNEAELRYLVGTGVSAAAVWRMREALD